MSTTIYTRRLTAPTLAQIEHGAVLMRDAFRAVTDDNFGDTLTGGNSSHELFLNRAGLRAAALEGQLWVAGFDEEVSEICALAAWFPPKTGYLFTEAQRAVGWDEAHARFSPELKKWYSEYFVPRISAWSTETLGKDVQYNSWYLLFLATSPDHQKKGLSAALISAVEPLAQEGGAMMCLETSNAPNVAFYEKRGFRVRGEISIVGAGGEHTLTSLSKP